MALYDKIRAAYPQAVEGDFRLEDQSQGDGPQIAYWNEGKLGPAPDPASLPEAPLFQGGEVASAADVDRATAGRIAGYLAPQWAGDPLMQTRALLRQLEDAAAARDALEDPGSTQAQKDQANALLAAARTRRAQVLAYRQEGADFKAARGW